MTDLDTSAYTPAHKTENNKEQQQKEEPERTRFQIPLDQGREQKILNRIEEIEEELLEKDNELKQKFQEMKKLLDSYDLRKFVKMYRYTCDKCGETFDTKQGIGVHHAMNPNCNNKDKPWKTEQPTYTKKRVDKQ